MAKLSYREALILREARRLHVTMRGVKRDG